MILSVTWDKTTYIEAPGKFEAGTPPIAAAIGLGEAIRYLSKLDLQDVHTHEQHLLRRASEGLKKIPGLRILGESADKVSVVVLRDGDPFILHVNRQNMTHLK